MKIDNVSSIAEPDNFAVGTDLADAFPYLTLSVVNEPLTDVIARDGYSLFLGRDFASTGDVVFGMDPPHPDVPQAWSEQHGLLRIDFERGTDFVQIDLGADDDDIGVLRAYDANGQLIGSVQVGSSEFRAQYASPSISFDDAQIAYVTVGGIESEGMWLDNLRFGVVGSSANDTMRGTSLSDHYNGLAGNDRIEGRGGNDTLIGGSGRDTILGGDGIDLLSGGAGKDRLFGNAGSDTLNGGLGADTLTGGAQNDIFTLLRNETGGDVITDFSGAGIAGGDSLRFEGFGTGATLSHTGDDWTVTYSGGAETFEITGVTALITSDYLFV